MNRPSWSIDETLIATVILGQSEPGSNDNEEVTPHFTDLQHVSFITKCCLCYIEDIWYNNCGFILCSLISPFPDGLAVPSWPNMFVCLQWNLIIKDFFRQLNSFFLLFTHFAQYILHSSAGVMYAHSKETDSRSNFC